MIKIFTHGSSIRGLFRFVFCVKINHLQLLTLKKYLKNNSFSKILNMNNLLKSHGKIFFDLLTNVPFYRFLVIVSSCDL